MNIKDEAAIKMGGDGTVYSNKKIHPEIFTAECTIFPSAGWWSELG